jgi:putative ABC transport system permease protein
LVSDYPFEFSFLDESFEKLYRAEERMSQVAKYITILIIFVACLGLFGLASFMAEKRTKEIGIRKVLGASVPRLVLLLSTEFSKWVIVANMIAWPVAYFIMQRWLANFAYRINIGLWMFFMAAFLALATAMLTVGYRAIKTAVANPVEALRYE